MVEKGGSYHGLILARGGERGWSTDEKHHLAPRWGGMSSTGVFSSALQTSHLFRECRKAFGHCSIL